MSAASRAGDTFERAIPVVAVAAIVLVAYVSFVQPRITEYLRNRIEIASLETRVRALQDTVNRGRSVPSPDEAAALTLFEERMSRDDKVSEVVELVARLAEDSAPKGQVRGVQIATGASIQWAPGQATSGPRTTNEPADPPDPRFGLFPAAMTYTPVTVSFESSYDAITRFAWQLRDMPTMIEIRSMELTRGLPLMRATVRLFVFQRGAAVASPAMMPPGPAGSPTSSVTPRVARLSPPEGW